MTYVLLEPSDGLFYVRRADGSRVGPFETRDDATRVASVEGMEGRTMRLEWFRAAAKWHAQIDGAAKSPCGITLNMGWDRWSERPVDPYVRDNGTYSQCRKCRADVIRLRAAC